jgi:acyl-CoA thioesterase YciA
LQKRRFHPPGALSLRMVAMQTDSNVAGEMSREWVLYSMDLAAVVAAGALAKGRVATAAVSNLKFLQPVKIGDVVCFYTVVTKTGRTSITVAVEAHALRCNLAERIRATAAEFVVVAVDDEGLPRPLPVVAL